MKDLKVIDFDNFDNDKSVKVRQKKELSKLETLLIDTKIKKLKVKENEPESFYEIKGVFLNCIINDRPLLLVYTYYPNHNSYQIIEYQTGTVCQKPKQRKPKDYQSLEALKSAKHIDYFQEELRSRSKTLSALNITITNIEDLILYLVDNVIKQRGILNKIPKEVLAELTIIETKELEDMF